jgi:outer membrane murein-binding lipoprotein Lpp
MNRKLITVALSATLLAGCTSTGALRREIATIEQRVSTAEAEVTAQTQNLANLDRDIQTKLAYRPLIAWADAFSARPDSERTIRFQQTDRGGALHEKDHKCYWDSGDWSWIKKDGERARIHEERSTRIAVEIKRFVVEPTATGLILRAPMEFDGKTQIEGNFRLRCTPATLSTNIGITGEARPNSVFRIAMAEQPGGAIGYKIALESPDRIGMEMRAHFQNWFRIGFTIPVENLARTLGEGQIDLLFQQSGIVVMPDGTEREYTLANAQPRFASTVSGVELGTNVVLKVE